MDLDTFKREWQNRAAGTATVLKGAEVMTMVRQETMEIGRRVRQRLRSEAAVYVAIVVGTIATTIGGTTESRVAAILVTALVVGAIPAALWLSQRRIDAVRFDRSVRDTLTDLQARLETAGKVYLRTYVAVIVAAVIGAGAIVTVKYGMGLILALTLVGSVAAVAGAYDSGRRYVERIFRRYRAELARCLEQLD